MIYQTVQTLNYLNDQITFLDKTKPLINKIKIRTDTSEFGWEIKKISLKFNEISFENSNASFYAKKCKICICTYNATVFLEPYLMVSPTIIFFELNSKNQE